MPRSEVIVTGATGRLARLLRPRWPGATWLARGDPWPEGQGGTILNLAGVTDHRGPLEDNLVTAAAAIAEGERRGARVFLMSTAAVYGGGDGAFSEDDPPAPLNPYGASKLAMEALPGEAVFLRLGNVVGADSLLGAPRGEVVLDPVPPLGPVRSYIGPGTLARVLETLFLTPDLPRVLNLAEPEPVAMGALLEAAGLPWRFGPEREATVPRVVMDTARLQAICPLPPPDPARMIAEWRGLA